MSGFRSPQSNDSPQIVHFFSRQFPLSSTIHLQALFGSPMGCIMRASSSVGQSWRLITAWSRVQILPGPPKKDAQTLVCASFFIFRGHQSGRRVRREFCSSGCGWNPAASGKPACRYVLNKDGKPLMPTTRCGHVRYKNNAVSSGFGGCSISFYRKLSYNSAIFQMRHNKA